MFRVFISAALCGLFLTLNPVFADSPDEAAFKKLLVERSPWSVEWENIAGRFSKGAHKLRFVMNGTTLAGELFDSTRESGKLPLKNLSIETKDNKTCVKFIVDGQDKRTYNYCLKGGILKGEYEWLSPQGNRYTGEAAATPAKR